MDRTRDGLDPLSKHRYYLDLVRALFMARRSAEAILVLERAARNWEHYLWLAACHADGGSEGAAIKAAQVAMQLRPSLSIATYLNGWFVWRRSEDKEHLRTALLKAGVS